MKIRNLMTHSLRIAIADGSTAVIKCEDTPAFVNWGQRFTCTGEGIILINTSWEEIQNLPDPEPGTIFVVDYDVALRVAAETGRDDVYTPDVDRRASCWDDQGDLVLVPRLICLS